MKIYILLRTGDSMETATIQEIRDRQWEPEIERNKKPVFVMFYSPTCVHCTNIMPHIEKIAEDYGNEVAFYKINLLQFEYLGERYGVMATPTFIFFCGGKVMQSRVGAVFPPMIKKMVEEMIEHGEECRIASTEWKYEITGYG